MIGEEVRHERVMRKEHGGKSDYLLPGVRSHRLLGAARRGACGPAPKEVVGEI